MIQDSLKNSHLYYDSSKALKKAFTFINELDPSSPDGSYEIDGEALFAILCSYPTRQADSALFEAHKKYIDIQVVLAGQERIDVSLDEDIEVSQPYDEDKDVVLFNAPQIYSTLMMRAGEFAIFYPQDIHRPSCSIKDPQDVRKLVVKVRV